MCQYSLLTSCSPITLFTFHLNVTSSCISLFALLSWLTGSFVIFSFWKMPLELIKWQKREAPQSYKLCCLSHELVCWQLWEEWQSATSVIVMSVCYSQGDLWIAELAERFVVYEVYDSTLSWALLVGCWYYFVKSLVIEVHVWNLHSEDW